jgi:hypothetical protein
VADDNEDEFEAERCAHLAANGWLHGRDDASHDRVVSILDGEQKRADHLSSVMSLLVQMAVQPDATGAG